VKFLSKIILFSLIAFSVDSASAQSRPTRCPKHIGKLSNGTYVGAKDNYRCFSSDREAKKEGFLKENLAENTNSKIVINGYGKTVSAKFKIEKSGNYTFNLARGGTNCTVEGLDYGILNSKGVIVRSAKLYSSNWFHSINLSLSADDYKVTSVAENRTEPSDVPRVTMITCEWNLSVN